MLGRCHGTTPACKLAGSPGQCGFGRRKVCIQQTHPAMTISILIGIGLADPTSAAQLPKQTVLFVGDLQADAALIKAMVSSTAREDFVTATQALDRVMTTGRYVIPFWYSNVSRMALKRELRYPDRLPIYGDWLGFLPDVWWYQN